MANQNQNQNRSRPGGGILHSEIVTATKLLVAARRPKEVILLGKVEALIAAGEFARAAMLAASTKDGGAGFDLTAEQDDAWQCIFDCASALSEVHASSLLLGSGAPVSRG